ncbi:MAG: T9SS type A sorting domain-containing protein [Saprospiraceae bacterium]
MKKRFTQGALAIGLAFVVFFLLHGTARAQCNNNTVLSLTGPNTSFWTAPSSGGPFSVRITVSGASGGAYLESNPDNTGGSGATMSGTFIVQNGETLFAVAGGGGFHSQLEGGGGGGGSGVVNCGNPSVCPSGILLILAAGGNGGQLGGPTGGQGLGGSADTNGDGDGGLIGDNDSGGGGGALNGDGESASSGGDGGGQVLFNGISPGGEGSRNLLSNPPSGINDGGNGMGGGGGGGDGATADNAAGGGGGHSGGDAGNVVAASSFNSGDDPADTPGTLGAGSSGPKSTPSNPGTISIVCLQALPVALLDFRVVLTGPTAKLLWSTASELENMGFEIERSTNGSQWTHLGFVAGHGTTTEIHQYTFNDPAPAPGVNYYRLKQTDDNGKFEYSPIAIADVRSNEHPFSLYPNPSPDGYLMLRVDSPTEGDALLEIYDWAGYRVYKKPVPLLKGTVLYPVLLNTFPKGAYAVRMEMPGGKVFHKKVVLTQTP